MRLVIAASSVIVLSAALAACSPANTQSTTGSGGAAAGTTLHISVVDRVSALIGGELLGSASSGTDSFEGDLVPDGTGTWRGTVTGRVDRTIEVVVLDDHCKTAVAGTQQLEAVATKGTFEEGRNLQIVLSPLSTPSYTKTPDCAPNPKDTAANGIEWLWFYLNDYKDSGMAVKLPASPGGTWTWEFDPSPNQESGYPGGCGEFEFLRCEQKTTLTVEYR